MDGSCSLFCRGRKTWGLRDSIARPQRSDIELSYVEMNSIRAWRRLKNIIWNINSIERTHTQTPLIIKLNLQYHSEIAPRLPLPPSSPLPPLIIIMCSSSASSSSIPLRIQGKHSKSVRTNLKRQERQFKAAQRL